ncbi:uncharacterized protein K452DRAFT_155420 [Aplosporella prunicola CBS 121167]|uniref:Uncharacterized protein n=1 Tax=Aplosporella prunicola CBS 121167 TaxID=1176127 RepID=A0A6A6BKQ7_9PEZI|nr:uncharacterized protein K452DRAFT_155420 [Aplosporella prunicola CBS 121167]KAF2144258.1 hypothetical protein K452DRAFT_155420 [Aplosporella prunicola CBS 121167]
MGNLRAPSCASFQKAACRQAGGGGDVDREGIEGGVVSVKQRRADLSCHSILCPRGRPMMSAQRARRGRRLRGGLVLESRLWLSFMMSKGPGRAMLAVRSAGRGQRPALSLTVAVLYLDLQQILQRPPSLSVGWDRLFLKRAAPARRPRHLIRPPGCTEFRVCHYLPCPLPQ